MSRTLRIAFGVIPSVFALLAFIFVVVATTSKEWAQKSYYPPDLSEAAWDKPIFTIFRSPFIVCGATLNHTISIPTTNSTIPSENGTSVTEVVSDTYTVSCIRFKPFGFNRTSCESLAATQNDTSAVYHDRRICQQIHFSANLAIASCVFMAIGMVFAFGLTYVSIRDSDNTKGSSNSGILVPGLNAPLLCFLTLGAVMLILSQAYAILGLVQSMPDNGRFASTGTVVTDAEPWIQGKALSVYASVSWLAAFLAAGSAVVVWRVSFPSEYSAVATSGDD